MLTFIKNLVHPSVFLFVASLTYIQVQVNKPVLLYHESELTVGYPSMWSHLVFPISLYIYCVMFFISIAYLQTTNRCHQRGHFILSISLFRRVLWNAYVIPCLVKLIYERSQWTFYTSGHSQLYCDDLPNNDTKI